MVRYPHTAVISYKSAGSYEGNIYTPGREVTLEIGCRVEPSSGKYIVNENGDKIAINYKIFCELFDDDIPETSKITFLEKTFKILSLFKYQKHIMVRC